MKSILVVDDEISFSEQMVELLQYEGYEATCASSVKQAEEVLAKTSFDLLIVDLMMPLQSGLMLINKVDKTKGTQIILMSASKEPLITEGPKKWDMFLRKPFDIEHLLNIVQRHAHTHLENI